MRSSAQPVILALALALLGASPASAGSDDDVDASELSDEDWLVRTARMEGAARNVVEASAEVKRVARTIEDEGRLGHLSELGHAARLLNKRVVSARLAAEVLDEPISE